MVQLAIRIFILIKNRKQAGCRNQDMLGVADANLTLKQKTLMHIALLSYDKKYFCRMVQ